MKIDAINPSIIVVETSNDVRRRLDFCLAIANDIAEGRIVITVNTKEDIVAMCKDDGLINKVAVMADSDGLIPARRSASKINLLVGYLVSQCRKRNMGWVFGCKDYSKIEMRVRRQCDLIVRAR